jgi:hypothetical protein
MQNIEKVKGFNKLNAKQQEAFKEVHGKHLKVVGNRESWAPTSVRWDNKDRCFIVRFVNGDWLHYTVGGDWY